MVVRLRTALRSQPLATRVEAAAAVAAAAAFTQTPLSRVAPSTTATPAAVVGKVVEAVPAAKGQPARFEAQDLNEMREAMKTLPENVLRFRWVKEKVSLREAGAFIAAIWRP